MAETTTTSSIVRQAPFLEEIQRKILDQALARGETPIDVPEIQVAAQDPLTTQAIETGAGIGSFMPYFTKGAGTIDEGLATLKAQATGVPGLLEEAAATARGADELPTQANIQALMDPYQSLVTEQATAELARQADIERNKILAQQAGIGALGGDRGQLQLAELQRNLTDLQSRRIFEDMSKNFQQAQNAFQNQQQRQQQVSQLLTGIGQTTGQEAQRLGQGIGAFGEAQQQLAGAGQALTQSQTQLLAGLGNLRQQQAQTELDAARQSQLQQIYEPFQRIGFTSDIFKPNIGSAATTLGTNVAPSPSPLSQAIGAGTAVLGGIKAFGNPFESIFKPSSTQ